MLGGSDFYFVLGEKSLRQLNELDGVEKCYMKGHEGKGGTDAR
jgi:hypothetical protein